MKKLLLIFAVLLAFALVSCDPEDLPEVQRCEHDDEIVDTATCISDGEYILTCKKCGRESRYPSYKDQWHHSWETESTEEPTCTEKGKDHKVCIYCGEKKTISSNALGHNMVENGWYTITPTCQSDGMIESHCTRCDETAERIIPKSEDYHLFGNKGSFFWPTCTEEGAHNRICEKCGIQKTFVMEALGHDWDEGIVTKEPSETEHGIKTYSCRREGCDATREEIIHNWTDGDVLKAQTCSEDGEKEIKCSVCDEKKKESIPADGVSHPYSDEWEHDNSGYHWHTVSCDHEVPPASCNCYGEHTLGDEVTVTEASTCTKEGKGEKTCTLCGAKVEVSIPLDENAHTMSTDWSGDDDYHWHGTECGHDITTDNGEHDWRHVSVEESATCKKDGLQEEECTICGRRRISVLKASEAYHLWGNRGHYRYPTCTTDGEHYRICDNCGATSILTLSALGHDWDEGTVKTESTSSKHGIMVYSCRREGCDATMEDDHHYWQLSKVIKEATCSEGGKEERICLVCSKKEVFDTPVDEHKHTFFDHWVGDPHNHHWHPNSCRCILEPEEMAGYGEHVLGDLIITKEATCTEFGEAKKICKTCGIETYFRLQMKEDNHTYKDQWSFDASKHWHDPYCIHVEKSDEGDHQWSILVLKEGSCNDDREVKYTCTICDYSKVETTDTSDNHSFSSDWSHDSKYHWHDASCGHSVTSDKAEHTWSEKVLKYPTCSSTGKVEKTCTGCGAKSEEDIPSDGNNHTFSFKWSHDENSHWHSSTCGHDVSFGKDDHDFEDEVLKKGNCQEDGQIKHTCSTCGFSYTETISKESLGHVVVDGENGLKKCSLCDEVFYFFWRGGSVSTRPEAYSVTVETLKVPAYCYDINFQGYYKVDSIKLINGITFTNLVISDGIETVERQAVSGRSCMKELDLGGTIKRIDQEAFINCTRLESIHIPTSVTYVGDQCFANCTGLEEKGHIYYRGTEEQFAKFGSTTTWYFPPFKGVDMSKVEILFNSN